MKKLINILHWKWLHIFSRLWTKFKAHKKWNSGREPRKSGGSGWKGGGVSSDAGNPGRRGVKYLDICLGCVDFFGNNPWKINEQITARELEWIIYFILFFYLITPFFIDITHVFLKKNGERIIALHMVRRAAQIWYNSSITLTCLNPAFKLLCLLTNINTII